MYLLLNRYLFHLISYKLARKTVLLAKYWAKCIKIELDVPKICCESRKTVPGIEPQPHYCLQPQKLQQHPTL